ncbi:MAG TPA: hydroxymethylbilane synthase [Chromatiales bacterium]|nr:hydroxymethylbilane synthase [Chromatiales bacterium]
MNLVRIATRRSALALWQARHVAQRLQALHPGLRVELVGMTTQGDRILDSPLSRVGGKGLFVKELEQGLLDGRADIAVHSMKDVPAELPAGLHLPVILKREDPRDAFVSNRFSGLDELPPGARLGTSSLRRECMIRARHPTLRVLPLRGNVNTRLSKLDAGEYEAIVLASAGLVRLGMKARITARLPIEDSLPAIGQGAIGIECRQDDDRVAGLIEPLDDPITHRCVTAERALNARLAGGCQVPLAGHAQWHEGRIRLKGLLGMPDGSRVLTAQAEGDAEEPAQLGVNVAESLLAQGGGEILRSLGIEPAG